MTTKVIPLRPFKAEEHIARLAELQRKFDSGGWTGDEALGFVGETTRIRAKLKEEFGMTELQIETALWNLTHN
ncbi:MAG TPA: hypothetical protein VL500_02775 [Candidatus Eisenbacteria bacterium]|nr:hypothetical protein [Candidatus Eisenbacteria bacterium]